MVPSINEDAINKSILGEIIARRFYKAPLKIKEFFPDILKDEHRTTLHFITPHFLLTSFVSLDHETITTKFMEQGYEPYPGLIIHRDSSSEQAVYNVNKKLNWFKNINVKYQYCFYLNPDSSLIIEDLSQEIRTDKLGLISYNVKLAYVVSFGNEITIENFYDYLDDLFLFSIEKWRSSNESRGL